MKGVIYINGVGDSEFKLERRFREFKALNDTLVQRWPGINIPAIPGKTKI